MKKSTYSKILLALSTMLIGATSLFAQEAEISDEELERYAIAMDSVAAMTANVKTVIADMVASNEEITGARYNELSKAIAKDDKEEKLAELEATEAEIAFVNEVKTKRDQLKKEINTTFQSLAKEYLGDGGRVYKKIKTALKSDEAIKAKYDEILARVKEERAQMRESLASEEGVENDEETSGGQR